MGSNVVGMTMCDVTTMFTSAHTVMKQTCGCEVLCMKITKMCVFMFCGDMVECMDLLIFGRAAACYDQGIEHLPIYTATTYILSYRTLHYTVPQKALHPYKDTKGLLRADENETMVGVTPHPPFLDPAHFIFWYLQKVPTEEINIPGKTPPPTPLEKLLNRQEVFKQVIQYIRYSKMLRS